MNWFILTLFFLANGAWLAHCLFAYRMRADIERKAPEYAKAVYCVWGDAGAISWPIRVVPLFSMEAPISVRGSALALRMMLALCMLFVVASLVALIFR